MGKSGRGWVDKDRWNVVSAVAFVPNFGPNEKPTKVAGKRGPLRKNGTPTGGLRGPWFEVPGQGTTGKKGDLMKLQSRSREKRVNEKTRRGGNGKLWVLNPARSSNLECRGREKDSFVLVRGRWEHNSKCGRCRAKGRTTIGTQKNRPRSQHDNNNREKCELKLGPNNNTLRWVPGGSSNDVGGGPQKTRGEWKPCISPR